MQRSHMTRWVTSAAAICAARVWAAAYTWDGGGANNNWGTPANWSPDLSAAGDLSGADLTFNTTAGSAGGSASAPAITVNDQSGLRINSLAFSGYPTPSKGWRINGNAFALNAGGINVSANVSGSGVTITNGLTLSASQSWKGVASSTLVLSGNLTAAAGVTVNLAHTTTVGTQVTLTLGGNNVGFAGNLVAGAERIYLTFSLATAMVGGNIDLGSHANARLNLSPSGGIYTFGLGSGNGNIKIISSHAFDLNGGYINWNPGLGADFSMTANIQVNDDNPKVVLGAVASKMILTGNRQFTADNNGELYNAQLLSGLSDDGTARSIDVNRGLLILTSPAGNPGSGTASLGGKVTTSGSGLIAISNTNQIFNGNLDASSGIVLDGVSWTTFRANRSSGRGTGTRQWTGLSFAARTTKLTIDKTGTDSSTWNNSFSMGCNYAGLSGAISVSGTAPYANASVDLQQDIALTAVRTITARGIVPTSSGLAAENRISGDISGAGAIVVDGNGRELVLAGYNTWTVTPTVSSSGVFSAGPGGLATIASIFRFDDTQLSSGTSIPQGNGGSASFLVSWGNNVGGGGVRGFMVTGDSDGQVYTLPSGMRVLIGSNAPDLGNMGTGLFGSSGGEATLSNMAIISHIGNTTAVAKPFAFVRDGTLHLGDVGGPVRFQHATGATGAAPAASTLTEAGTTGLVNNEIQKIGIGTLVLDNVAYTDLSGAGDYSSNHKWTIGNAAADGTLAFSGAVRETGTSASNSIRGNAGLGNTKMQGGVIEIGVAGDFTTRLGTAAGQLDMSGQGGAGFAAYGDRRVVRLTNSSGVLGGDVGYGSGNFVKREEALTFGSLTANNTAVLMNRITAGGGGGQNFMATVRGVGTAPEGEIAGSITSVDSPLRLVARTTPWGTALPAGTLVFSGANTYDANTQVEAGTLLVNGSLSTRSRTVTVYSGATLGGTGTISRAVSVQSGGILAPGNLNAAGTLTVSSLTLASGAVYKWTAAGSGDRVNVTGTLTLPATASVIVAGSSVPVPAVLFSAGGLAGATDLSGWTVTGVGGARVAIEGTQVVLKVARGTAVLIR